MAISGLPPSPPWLAHRLRPQKQSQCRDAHLTEQPRQGRKPAASMARWLRRRQPAFALHQNAPSRPRHPRHRHQHPHPRHHCGLIQCHLYDEPR